MELLLDRHTALGTMWWIEVNLPAHLQADQLRQAILAHLTDFEVRYSRFQRDSLISQLNHDRILVEPDTQLIELLRFGQSLYQKTAGHFNLLLGDVLTARGYGRERAEAITETVLTATPSLQPNPLRDLLITTKQITLSSGSVDIGGFGKGYVIDELVTLLQTSGITDFLINGGGDMYGSSDYGQPFTIYLEHPTIINTYIGTTTLFHQGFAASSPFKRTWKQNGVTQNHIIGGTDVATFVTAPTARDADAWATMSLLAKEDELAAAVAKEGFCYARFDPATGELSRTNFPFSPLK